MRSSQRAQRVSKHKRSQVTAQVVVTHDTGLRLGVLADDTEPDAEKPVRKHVSIEELSHFLCAVFVRLVERRFPARIKACALREKQSHQSDLAIVA